MWSKTKTTEEPGLRYFTVFDSKGKMYNEPFPSMNRETAIREFITAFKHPEASIKNRYYMNAEDYSIFECGAFDHKTGTLVGSNLDHVVNLHDLRAMVTPPAQNSGIVPT